MVTIAAKGPRRGRALVSYLREGAAIERDDDPRLDHHTNRWESRCLVRCLAARGFAVDVIDFKDADFEPRCWSDYDVVLDIGLNLGRWHERLPGSTRRLMHLTGSWFGYSNAAIALRLDDLERRRGVRLEAVATRDAEAYGRSIEAAEACSLIGNATTHATYPERWRAKLVPMKVTASRCVRKNLEGDRSREFLWFNGADPVLKGLDLVLEAFADRPDRTLHVVGPVRDAAGFHETYQRELEELPNIRLHGWMNPASAAFGAIAERCVAFVSASCTEGMSSSAVTAMKIGLLPIVSRNTGVDLPAGCGRIIEHASIESIGAAVDGVDALSDRQVLEQARTCRAMIEREHSRAAFSARMASHLDVVLG